MMQMNFKLAPTFMAVRRQAVDQSPLILLRGKKISVNEGAPFLVAPRTRYPGIFKTPPLNPARLLGKESASPPIFGHNGWFKMIRESEDQMHHAARSRPGQPLPGVTWKPAHVGEFAQSTSPARLY